MEIGTFEAGNPNNMFVWKRNYQPSRATKQGAGSFRRLPWGYKLTNIGIRESIGLWEKGTKYYDTEKKSITHVIIPFKNLDPDDFSHAKERARFSRLKTVMTRLRKKVPSCSTLFDGYEKYIVPYLHAVISRQKRSNKTKVRRLTWTTWHKYLLQDSCQDKKSGRGTTTRRSKKRKQCKQGQNPRKKSSCQLSI